MSTYRLVLLLAASCLVLNRHKCSGSEDTGSSFRRQPPPPPGSFYSAPTTGTTNNYGEENRFDDYYDRRQQQTSPPPPPPPPPPPSQSQSQGRSGETQRDTQQTQQSSSSPQRQDQQNPSLPIHYEFPINEDDERDQRPRRDNNREGSPADENDREVLSATSSARKDLVTRYWSTKMGKLQIQTVVGLVGYGSGSFVAKSLVGGSDLVRMTGYFWAIFMVVSTWFRTPMGELSRAVGLSLILVLQRTQRIRREYPTWRYVAASVGIIRGGPRDARGRPRGPRPFPPARNPWRYTPRSPRDPDFNMIYTLVSMAMVGSTVGGNLPVIPNWIGALVGAATFAFACTWQNSHRGDLARTMGMRVVRAVTELWEIQADLQIIPKATVVSSQVIDKAMILDRKHRVKDRFLSFANKSYAQASKVAEQIQKQQRGANDKDENVNDGGRDRYRSNFRNGNGRRSEEDVDSKRGGEPDRDWRRDSRGRGRGRDEEGDRFYERGDDDRRQRRRYRNDDVDDDRFDSRGRSEPERLRQTNSRYEVERNGRDGDFTSGKFEDYNDDRDRFDDENQSEKKSKGFFFRKK